MINGKKVVGIVAEYNPFHTGHRYMLDKIRREYHADYIVAAMSGDFVQRGEPAMFDKYERAEEALKNGADLIVQIPVMFSTSSAEDFAAGGVAVLRSLGFVDELVFGSESADLEKLERMASVELAAGTKEYATFQNMVRDGVASGMSYPKARAEAMKAALLGDDETSFQALLQGVTAGKEVIDLRPNDVLGLEYLKAVHRQGDCFSVGCIRRNQELASAHSIRETMLKDPASLKGGYATLDMLSDMLSYRLLELCQLEERMREAPSLLTEYLDVSREIADALRHQVRERHSFSERIQIIKS
ncbi:MAG TPA: nucleotidyltransferase, partial [Oribacterium sp.]|nr:nucleotidyltransferase [Oribacterium sp.]